MDTTTSSAVTIVENGYAAFHDGDIPAVLALMDPQVRWTEAAGSAYPGTFVGHDALVQNVSLRLGEDWETFVPVPDEYVDLGGRVLVLGWFEGVHRGTGSSMRARFAPVFRVDDGRITAFESINDTSTVLAAMA